MIGLFGTYAVMNGGDGGRGSWDADGWGGGTYAEYWSQSLVLRGMISAGGYDGEHRRSINGETAKDNRSGNSWTGVDNQRGYCRCMANAYGKRYSGQELAAISNSIAVLGDNGPTIINLMMAPETRACSRKY